METQQPERIPIDLRMSSVTSIGPWTSPINWGPASLGIRYGAI